MDIYYSVEVSLSNSNSSCCCMGSVFVFGIKYAYFIVVYLTCYVSESCVTKNTIFVQSESITTVSHRLQGNMPCTMISSNKTFRSFIWRTLSSFLAISFAAYYVTTDFFVGARKHQDQGSARTDEGSPSRALSAHTRARSLTANQQKEDLWVISPMLLAGAVVDAGWAFRAVMDTMLEHINNSTTILPNHKLRLVYVDEKCIPKYGIEAFWNATIHQEYLHSQFINSL